MVIIFCFEMDFYLQEIGFTTLCYTNQKYIKILLEILLSRPLKLNCFSEWV